MRLGSEATYRAEGGDTPSLIKRARRVPKIMSALIMMTTRRMQIYKEADEKQVIYFVWPIITAMAALAATVYACLCGV